MASIKGNSIMLNVRGMIGRQVVSKSRMGTAYLAGRPNVNKRRKISNAEKSNRARFAAATRYAKLAMLDDSCKAYYSSYAAGGCTAYNVAFKDAWYGPQVTGIFTHSYKGNIGDVILVQATDNYKWRKYLCEYMTGQKF